MSCFAKSLALVWCLGSIIRLQAMAEDATESWIRFGEWRPVGIAASYPSVEIHGGRVELWFSAYFEGHDSVIHLSGADLSSLPRSRPRFDARLIQGYAPDLGNRATPIISRSAAVRLDDGSVLVQASIGPAYDGGRSELYPVLFHSANGVDAWRYLGPPQGKAVDWLQKQRQAGARIRCEGGGIIQLANRRLRQYQQNLGATLAILEADTVDGPWKFVRDDEGSIINAVEGLGGPWLFPHVSAIGDHGYILTAGNAWPPTAIRAAISRDGLRFTLVGNIEQSHLILRPEQVMPETQFLKTLRLAWDEPQQRLLAVANPWLQRNYPMFWTWAHLDLTIFEL